MDALLLVEALLLAHVVGEFAAVEHLLRPGRVETHLAGDAHQQGRVARVLSVGEVGLEERLLQCVLAAFTLGPVQQPVGVEGVVDAAARAHAEREPDRLATGADVLAVLRKLLRRQAVLLAQVFGDVLALGRHVRVQLERLEVQVDLQVGPDAFEGGFEVAQADGAPGAGDVGDEIDLHGDG